MEEGSKEHKKKEWKECWEGHYTWEEFDKKFWHYCERCKTWNDDFCICYAR